MNRNELQERTETIHINVIRLCERLSKSAAGPETAKQIIRAADSVGANYRAPKRAKSTNDFLNNLSSINKEL